MCDGEQVRRCAASPTGKRHRDGMRPMSTLFARLNAWSRLVVWDLVGMRPPSGSSTATSRADRADPAGFAPPLSHDDVVIGTDRPVGDRIPDAKLTTPRFPERACVGGENVPTTVPGAGPRRRRGGAGHRCFHGRMQYRRTAWSRLTESTNPTSAAAARFGGVVDRPAHGADVG